MAIPKYVRLADHLSRGIRADLNSGFSVAGLNVVPMPDKEEAPAAFAWAKAELAAGRLEGCGRAEYEEVHGTDVMDELGIEVKRTVERKGMPNESAIQRVAGKQGRALRRSRSAASEDEAFDSDRRRRKRTIEAQRKGVPVDEMDDAFDEDEEETPKPSKAAKAAAKATREAEAEARRLADEAGDDDEDEEPETEGDDSDGEADEEDDYDSWSPADLRAEIKERNEERPDDEKIKPAGKAKADLVAALVADDEDSADDE